MKNYWVGVDELLHLDVVDYLNTPSSYEGSVPVEHIEALVKGLHDPLTVISLFKPYQNMYLYSTYVSVQAQYDMLMLAYPETKELGCWGMDSTPLEDIHIDLINYMPDIAEIDDEGNIAGTSPATELVDVNLVGGQSPRDFS